MQFSGANLENLESEWQNHINKNIQIEQAITKLEADIKVLEDSGTIKE